MEIRHYQSCDMRDNDLGTALYKTSANADQSNTNYDPTDGPVTGIPVLITERFRLLGTYEF